MKQGNQFYLEFQIEDEGEQILNISSVEKIQFTLGELIKTYDGKSEEVTYDVDNHVFKIWLTENETFEFPSKLSCEARILFQNNTICGTDIGYLDWKPCLKKVVLNV